MLAGSFFLTPATALRYERHDRKVRQLNREEELGIGKDRRQIDINEEYYRLAAKVSYATGAAKLGNQFARTFVVFSSAS